MSFYRWCLRSGAPILFVIALAQFVFGLANAILMPEASFGRRPDRGADPVATVLWLQTVFAVMSSAALPFFGALLIDRLDRRAGETSRERLPE